MLCKNVSEILHLKDIFDAISDLRKKKNFEKK